MILRWVVVVFSLIELIDVNISTFFKRKLLKYEGEFEPNELVNI